MKLNNPIILESKLSTEEIIVNLKKIIRVEGSYNSNKYLFRGNVNHKGFRAFSLPYSLDNQMMILDFIGIFHHVSNDKIHIRISGTLTIELKFVFILGLILNLAIITVLYSNPIENKQIFTWKLYTFALTIGIIILSILFFNLKNKSIEMLKKAMSADVLK